MTANKHDEAIKWLSRAIEHVPGPQEESPTEGIDSKSLSLLVRHTLGEISGKDLWVWLMANASKLGLTRIWTQRKQEWSMQGTSRSSRESVLSLGKMISGSKDVLQEHNKSLAVIFLELQVLRDKADSGDETKVNQFFEGIVRPVMMQNTFSDLDLVLRTIINSAELTRQSFLA